MTNARFSILQARAVSDNQISNSQFRTLAALGMYGDKDGWCYPKLKTLGDLLGKSRQAVSKDIQHLTNLGYVEVTPQYRPDGSRSFNLYRLVFDHPVNVALTPRQPYVDTPSTTEVDTPSTSEVDALTPHINAPIEVVIGAASPTMIANKAFFEASTMPVIPSTQRERETQIYELTKYYGYGETVTAMKKAYQEWINTRRKDNARGYSRTNLGWVDWAQNELAGGSIGAPAKDPKDMTDDEYKAWVLQGADNDRA